MSRRAAAACALLAVVGVAAPAPAASRRFGLLVGSNEGRRDEVSLRYAESDARRLRDALLDVAWFAPEDTVLLVAPQAEDVVRALSDLRQRARAAAADGTQTLLLFYYSGHADEAALHVGGTDLPLERVHGLLEASAARVRLAILDACRAGGFSRLKGARAGPTFAIRLEDDLQGEGYVALTSSAADEDSQESDRLGGSFFTHHLVSGLRGAADRSGEGDVTLAELYRYAYHGTLQATQTTWAGAQHPGYRYDLRGRADLVLAARPSATPRLASLVLDRPGRWLVSDASRGEVVAELTAGPQATVLALRPGRYRVSRRDEGALLETEVLLTPAGSARLGEHELERIAYARLVRKGGPDAAAAAHGVQAGLGWQSALAGLSGSTRFAQVGYVLDLRWLSLRLLARMGEAQGRTPTLTYDLGQVGLELQVVHVLDLSRVSFGAGMTAGATWLDQRLGRGEGERQALGLTFGAVALVGVEVADGLTLELTGEAGTVTFPHAEARLAPVGEGSLASLLSTRAALGVRHAF